MSQLRLTCALPTTASNAVTVFAGPADAVEKLLVPAGVIAATRYWKDAPGNIAVVPSVHAVMDVHVNPETAPVTNGDVLVAEPNAVHVTPLSALRSMVYPVTVRPPVVAGAVQDSATCAVPPTAANERGSLGAAAVPIGPTGNDAAPTPADVIALTWKE